MKRIQLIVIGAAVLAAALVAYLIFGRGVKSDTSQFRLASIERGDVEAVVSATGTLSAVTTVQVGTQVSGRVEELKADFNDRVKKGQLIARIDPVLQEQAVRDAEAGVDREVPEGNHLREYHLWLLLVSLAVVVAAFLLRVRTDQRVEPAALPGLPLPELCQFRAVLGWDCPGCGLTRSFVYLAAGDVEASLAVNRVGWLFAAVVLLQVPYRLWAICSADGRPLGKRVPWVFLWVPFALLIANWLVKVLALLI